MRLNYSLKSEIKRKTIDKYTESKYKAIKEKRFDIFDDLFEFCKNENKNINECVNLYSHGFLVNKIQVKESETLTFYSNDKNNKEYWLMLNWDIMEDVFILGCSGSTVTLFSEKIPFNILNKIKRIEDEENDLEKYKSELSAELQKMLDKCNTIKQLLKVFPEIEVISGVSLTSEEKPAEKTIKNPDVSKLNLLLEKGVNNE